MYQHYLLMVDDHNYFLFDSLGLVKCFCNELICAHCLDFFLYQV